MPPILCLLFLLKMLSGGLAYGQMTPTLDQVSSSSLPKDLTRTPDEMIQSAQGRWALLIGIDDYDDKHIQDLKFPASDATSLADVLISSGAYTSNQVIVMTPDQPDERLKPTRGNILAQLRRLQQVKSGDTVMFYFSGHGAAQLEGGEKRNFIFPMDTNLAVPEDTAISVEAIANAIDTMSGFERRIVLFDACRAQLSVDQKALAPTMQQEQYSSAVGTQILFSTRFGGVSIEREDVRMGAFTFALIGGLQGAADGLGSGAADGIVDMGEAYFYIDQELQRLDPPQIPWRAGEARQDIPVVPVRGDSSTEAVPLEICPTSDREVRGRTLAAIQKFGSLHTWDFWTAYETARRARDCAGEPLTLETILAIHRLEALRLYLVKDTQGVVLTLAAHYQLSPASSMLQDVPNRPAELKQLAEMATERASSRTDQVPLPKGVDLYTDGVRTQLRPLDRPAVIQALNWDGSVQWTEWLPAQSPLPDIALPPASERIQAVGTTLKLSTGLMAATSLSLGVGAFMRQRQFDELTDAVARGLGPDNPLEQGRNLQQQANRMGYAAQTGAVLTLGLAMTSFVVTVRF